MLSLAVQAQQTDKQVFEKIFDETMLHGEAYDNLHDLCKNIGHRLAGSPQADMAVRWSYELMQSYDLDSVWLQEVMVPHWVRGAKEYGEVINFGQAHQIHRQLGQIKRNTASGLGSVHMEDDALFTAQRSDGSNVLNHANFVIDEHHTGQNGVGANGGLEGIQIHQPVGLHIKVGHLKT